MARMAFAIALVVCFCPAIARGWGGEGHQLIALIPDDQLMPAAKAAVKELLDGANISDAEVVSWADEIRRERRDTADWHYVTIPHDADVFERHRDGGDGENIIDAIDGQAKGWRTRRSRARSASRR